jgi:hypothetical protein
MIRSRRFKPQVPAHGQTQLALTAAMIRTCRSCGCTDNDCRQCIERTGQACHWVRDDLCSACVQPVEAAA